MNQPEPRTYTGSLTLAIMQLHSAGAPVRQIAASLRVSTQHVYRTLARYNERPNPPDNR